MVIILCEVVMMRLKCLGNTSEFFNLCNSEDLSAVFVEIHNTQFDFLI